MNVALPQWWRQFAVYVAATLALSLAAAYVVGHRSAQPSIFDLQFCVGETTQHWIAGLGMSCFEHKFPRPGDVLLLRSARMPVATLYATAAALTLGPYQVLAAMMLKTFLMLLPVYAIAALVLWRCVSVAGKGVLWTSLLAVPFLVPSFLSVVVNIEAEEGFSYAFLAVAFALIALRLALNTRFSSRLSLLLDLVIAASLALLYLAKSSMIVVVGILLLFYALQTSTTRRRLLVIALVIAAPLCWAMRQHSVSGRYTLGTSWDGENFYKGNNPHFLQHYPPPPFGNLDSFGEEIAPIRPLGSEWAYSDWQKQAAITYIRSHPRETMIGWGKKMYVLFFSLRVFGNTPQGLPPVVTLLGMVLLRLLLWTALGLSAWAAARARGETRLTGLLFLATVAGVAAPYVAGFGFTRHISVLLYPAAMAICLLLAGLRARTSGVTSAPKA